LIRHRTMMSDSDEDSFGTPTDNEPGARLRNLFGGEQQIIRKNSNPLMYEPPKKAKKQTAPPPDKAQPVVVFATAVQLYQFSTTSQKFDPVGKAGCAVLSSNGGTQYQILCYRSSKDYICSTDVTPTLNYTIQNGQYGSFYDSSSQLWSLLFQTVDDAVHFASFVAIAKFYVSNQSLSMVNLNEQAQHSQPRNDSSDDCVRPGATISVKYTGWLLDGTRLGKSFDSNASSDKSFSFKVGERSVIKGWKKEC